MHTGKKVTTGTGGISKFGVSRVSGPLKGSNNEPVPVVTVLETVSPRVFILASTEELK